MRKLRPFPLVTVALGVISWCVIKSRHKAKLGAPIGNPNRLITWGLTWDNKRMLTASQQGLKGGERGTVSSYNPTSVNQTVATQLSAQRQQREHGKVLTWKKKTLTQNSHKGIFVNRMIEYFLPKHKIQSCHAFGVAP